MPGQFINRSNSGGFRLVNNNNAGRATFNNGSHQWLLATDSFGYQPAWTLGVISWPSYTGNIGLDNPNDVFTSTAGFYINQYDFAGNDQTAFLTQMLENAGTVTFTQGSNFFTIGFQSGSWMGDFGMYGSIYADFTSVPAITVVSSSNTAFTGYPYGDTVMGGPLTYNDSGIAPNSSELVTITINISNSSADYLTTEAGDQLVTENNDSIIKN
jgi:hypothetical protein